jgi:sugar lactone lactonase YvrE
MNSTLLHKSPCLLGEGPFWHDPRQSFFWVDIDGKKLHEYNIENKKVNTWQFQFRPSLLSLDTKGQMMIAFQGRLARFDLETENLTWLMDIEKGNDQIRTNDGGIDPSGRLWIGTMHVQFKEGEGSLYCIGHDFSITKKISKLTIPNGLVWSLDGLTMYHIDSSTKKVSAYLFDKQTGEIKFDRIAITISPNAGSPDGMCMDEEGMLWIAHWDGFAVCRWNPDTGKLLEKIEVPVPQVSSCAFGGRDFKQLFITTARENFTMEMVEKYPESGSVYVAQVEVRGARKGLFGAMR